MAVHIDPVRVEVMGQGQFMDKVGVRMLVTVRGCAIAGGLYEWALCGSWGCKWVSD